MGLDDFVVGRAIGRGATATVYEAVHLHSGIRVAVKALSQPHGVRQALVDAEIQSMARLEHPNLLKVFDFGTAEAPSQGLAAGTAWMVVEYASGGTLESWRPTRWSELLTHLLQLLAGLSHAHSRGLLHRDLKPANLLVCEGTDGRPGLKIGDFGLAWAMNERLGVTRRCGTPAYMAPEQSSGGQLGPATDLYAIGNILWEWLMGIPPYERETVESTLRAHVGEPLPAYAPRFEVPEGVQSLALRLLQRKASKRPLTAAWVAFALSRLPLTTSVAWVPTSEAVAEPHRPVRKLTHGLGLGLLPYRDLPVVGRTVEQDSLWTLLEKALTGDPQVACIGPGGAGSTRIAQWLYERVIETGVADAYTFDGKTVSHALTGVVEMRGSPNRLLRAERNRPTVMLLTNAWESLLQVDLIADVLLEKGQLRVLLLAPGANPGDGAAFSKLARFHRIELGPLPPLVLQRFGRDGLGLEYGLAADLALHSQGFAGTAKLLLTQWIERGILRSTPDGLTVDRQEARALTPSEGLCGQIDMLLRDQPVALEIHATLDLLGAVEHWETVLDRLGIPVPLELLERFKVAEILSSDLRYLEPAARGWLAERFDRAGRSAEVASVLPHHPARLLLELRGREDQERLAELESVLAQYVAKADFAAAQILLRRMVRERIHETGAFGRFLVAHTQLRVRMKLDGTILALPDLEHVLDRIPPVTARQRSALHATASQIYWYNCMYDEASYHLEFADLDPITHALQKGTILLDSGAVKEAVAPLMKAFEGGDSAQRSRAANAMGRMALMGGAHLRAIQWFEEEFASSEDSDRRLNALLNLAIVRQDQGRHDLALELCERCSTGASNVRPAMFGALSLQLVIAAIAERRKDLVAGHTERAFTYLRSKEAEDIQLTLNIVKRLTSPDPVLAETLTSLRVLMQQALAV